MGAYTITLPPATQAEIDGLIADARAAVQKYSALADTLGATASAITAEIPAIQASIQEIADAAKTFKFSGPMGIHGGSA
jgi:hypothetical protein